MPDLIEELGRLLGADLSTAAGVLDEHGRDVSYHRPAPPQAVAFPRTTEQVQRIVEICARCRTPIVPFGAGSSVEGQVTVPEGGVSVDLAHLNRILTLNERDMDVTVEAGVRREQLERRLEGSGLFFSVDPGADATLGGMASTRASGTTTVRYGTMRENVLGLQVVLADGRVIQTGGRSRKSSSGYDLTHLFVGAEGTLGLITRLTLRLHARPVAVSSAVCTFPGMREAIDAAIRTIRSGIRVARIELLDETMMDAVNRHAGLDYPARPTLFFEFHGGEGAVAELAQATEAITAELGAEAFRWATDSAERERLWEARHQAYLAARALRPESEALTTDVCVPITALAECILKTKQDLAGTGLIAPLVGHVGDGNFHLIVLIDPSDPEELVEAKALNERLMKRALALEGTCTGEHGIGIGKREFLAAEHGEAVDVMRSIKQALDPHGLFNPGKIFPERR